MAACGLAYAIPTPARCVPPLRPGVCVRGILVRGLSSWRPRKIRGRVYAPTPKISMIPKRSNTNRTRPIRISKLSTSKTGLAVP